VAENKIAVDTERPVAYTLEEEAILRLHRRVKKAGFGTVTVKYRNGEAKIGSVKESVKLSK